LIILAKKEKEALKSKGDSPIISENPSDLTLAIPLTPPSNLEESTDNPENPETSTDNPTDNNLININNEINANNDNNANNEINANNDNNDENNESNINNDNDDENENEDEGEDGIEGTDNESDNSEPRSKARANPIRNRTRIQKYNTQHRSRHIRAPQISIGGGNSNTVSRSKNFLKYDRELALMATYRSFKNVQVQNLHLKAFFVVFKQIVSHFECERLMFSWALKLISSERIDVRCFGAALIIQLVVSDYCATNTVMLSSVYLLDTLTETLLSKEIIVERFPVYRFLLDLLIPAIKNLNLTNLNAELEKRINNSRVIIDVVETQKEGDIPPEKRMKQTMRIADQYNVFPSMRLKWLQQLVKQNVQVKHYECAFHSQLHVAALIGTVLNRIYAAKKMISSLGFQNQNQNQNQNFVDAGMLLAGVEFDEIEDLDSQNVKDEFDDIKLLSTSYDKVSQIIKMLENLTEPVEVMENGKDILYHLITTMPFRNAQRNVFIDTDFLPFPGLSVENRYEIPSLTKQTMKLLSEFTLKALDDALTEAISLGKQAKLFYSLRYIYSMKIRLHQWQRDAPALKNDLADLSASLVRLEYDLPFDFYLVDKNDGRRYVFTVPKPETTEEFVERLGRHHRYLNPVFQCSNHCKACQELAKVCVVKLIPIDPQTQIDNNEIPCVWNTFKAYVKEPEQAADEVTMILIKTRSFMPHYRPASKVVDFEEITMKIVDLTAEMIKNNVTILEKQRKQYLTWANLPQGNEAFFVEVLDPLERAVFNALSEELINMLQKLKELDQAETTKQVMILWKELKLINDYLLAKNTGKEISQKIEEFRIMFGIENPKKEEKKKHKQKDRCATRKRIVSFPIIINAENSENSSNPENSESSMLRSEEPSENSVFKVDDNTENSILKGDENPENNPQENENIEKSLDENEVIENSINDSMLMKFDFESYSF